MPNPLFGIKKYAFSFAPLASFALQAFGASAVNVQILRATVTLQRNRERTIMGETDAQGAGDLERIVQN